MSVAVNTVWTVFVQRGSANLTVGWWRAQLHPSEAGNIPPVNRVNLLWPLTCCVLSINIYLCVTLAVVLLWRWMWTHSTPPHVWTPRNLHTVINQTHTHIHTQEMVWVVDTIADKNTEALCEKCFAWGGVDLRMLITVSGECFCNHTLSHWVTVMFVTDMFASQCEMQ